MDDVTDLEFFNSIVKITKNSGVSFILNKDSQTIFDVVTKNYKKNIRIAADRGLYKAYICIYEANAKYKGVIPIDSFIRMNTTMREKFTEYKIEPVMERVRNKLKYFTIEVKSLYESELKNDVIISDLADTTNSIIRIKEHPEIDQENQEELVGIIASWEKND